MNPMEKLLPINNTSFYSFDNKGNICLYNIHCDYDDDISVKQKWGYINSSKDEVFYKNNVGILDESSFVLGVNNELHYYNPEKLAQPSIELKSPVVDGNISCLSSFRLGKNENQKILFCTENNTINLYDNRTSKKISLSYEIMKGKGLMNCICQSFIKDQFLISTLDGYVFTYDLRLNSVEKYFKYYNNAAILGMNLYKPSNKNIDCILDSERNYVVLYTGTEEHEIGFYDINNMDCDLLLKLNIKSNKNNELMSNEVEIPYFNLDNNDNYKDTADNYSLKYEYLTRFNDLHENIELKKKYSQIKVDDIDTYNQKMNNILNIYNNPNTVQCVLSPMFDKNHSSPYIISSGNDKVIRYWNLEKEPTINYSKKSYIINAPNNINFCNFTKGVFDRTQILQSNEMYNTKLIKGNTVGFSEYQNYNGTLYHSSAQKEFDENDDFLKYCTKISDPAHKGIITDMLCLNISDKEPNLNVLVSSSWDGTVKIWK